MPLSGAYGVLLRRWGWRLRISSLISQMAKNCWSCWRSSRARVLGNRTTERWGFTKWRTWTGAWPSCEPRQDISSLFVCFEGLTAALLKVNVYGNVTLFEGSTARSRSWRHRDYCRRQCIDTQRQGVTYQMTWVSPKRRVFWLVKNGSLLSGVTRQKVLKFFILIVLKSMSNYVTAATDRQADVRLSATAIISSTCLHCGSILDIAFCSFFCFQFVK